MSQENIDPESLRKLAEGFEKLSELMGKQVELNEKKIKQDQTNWEKTVEVNKVITDETVLRRKLIDTNEKSSKAEDKKTAAVLKGAQAYDDHMRSLGMVKNELGQFQKVTAELTSTQRQQMIDATRRNAISEMMEKARADKTGTILNGLAATGKFLNSTLFDSTKGQGKYGDAMEGLGGKIKDLGSLFGPLGKAVTFVAGSLFELAGAALKHNEAMNKAYETLSEFGQVDASGIPQLFQNLQNAGMVMKELDKFQDVMKGASQGLAFMGSSAADGAKQLTQVYGKTLNTQTERQLKNLGYTNEQAFKTFANYNTYLAKLGLSQGKSQNELTKGSTEYAKTLDELSKLTGIQRDELQERMRRNAEDVKFRYALMEATPALKANYEKMAMLAQDGGEDMAAGVREMIANGGAVVGEASAKLAQQTGGEATNIIKRLKAGEIDGVEASRQLGVATQATIKRMKEAGKLSAETAGAFGITAKTMEYANLWSNKSQADIEKVRQDTIDQMDDNNDAQRAAEVQRQITERNAEQSKDKFLQLVGKGLAPAFEKLMEIVNRLGKALASFVKFITFGKVDMTELYETPQDKIKNKQEEINALEKKKEHAGYNGMGGYDETQRVLEQAELEKEIQAKRQEVERLKKEMGVQSNQAAIDKADADVKTAEARLRAEKELTLKQMNLTEDKLDKASTEDKKAFADQLAKNHKEWTLLLNQSKEKLLEEMKKSDEMIAGAVQGGAPGGGGGGGGGGATGSTLDKIINVESKGDATAQSKTSSAYGLGQFTKGTFESISKRKDSSVYGKSWEEYKKSPEIQRAALSDLTKFNQNQLASQGIGVTDTATYLAHFLGAGGASKLYKAGDSALLSDVVGADQMRANQSVFKNLRTVRDLKVWAARKMGEDVNVATASSGTGKIPGAATGGMFSGPSSGYPVMLHGNEVVIPMPNTDALGAISQVNKQPLADAAGAGQQMDLTPLFKMMADKFDELIKHAQNSHSTQEELLLHARN